MSPPIHPPSLRVAPRADLTQTTCRACVWWYWLYFAYSPRASLGEIKWGWQHYFASRKNLTLSFSTQAGFMDLFWDVNRVISAVTRCRCDGEIAQFKRTKVHTRYKITRSAVVVAQTYSLGDVNVPVWMVMSSKRKGLELDGERRQQKTV